MHHGIPKSIALVAVAATLSGCMSGGPGWTHVQQMPDKSAVIAYDCGSLEGEAASRALKSSHRLYVSKYHGKSVAWEAKIAKLQAQGGHTPEQIQEYNAKTYALKDEIREGTAAKGCTMKGVLDAGSAARQGY
ncbi:hypothetical protein [Aliiroseovarius sp. F20344]|uniref:hypothetical protein n=1 Tax=Aliiroseovarius sp. F20344 TaxID=2926414 RepID=UPI001FF65AB7|nr:hypothetical protein [Aliiroseovarius sp. F20344]MCK0143771.1 hypothetical protein [Aliiroseovarius sp. F20344]